MVSRRDFLLGTAGLYITAATPKILLADETVDAGWVYDKLATKKFTDSEKSPYFSQVGKSIAGSGKGKRALLWKFLDSVSGTKLVPHDQGNFFDCVAQGWALGVDILDAVQIYHGTGKWVAKCAVEPVYAGGRVEVGKGRLRHGMHGTWAAQWCRDWGILLRQPYLNGKYDFTTYSGDKAKTWAHICNRCTTWGGGVPDELEPLARQHPVQTTTLVKSWEEARDALYNGYPIPICSSQGFQVERIGRKRRGVRDKDGFLTPGGKAWRHCMLLAGMDDTGSRPGGLIINSWGTEWVEGPTRLNQPVGSFWADADVIDDMLKYEDSFAMSNYVGYPRQYLDYRLW